MVLMNQVSPLHKALLPCINNCTGIHAFAYGIQELIHLNSKLL
jgi:hypothetical protein